MKKRDEQQLQALSRLGIRQPATARFEFKAIDPSTLENVFSLAGAEQSPGEIMNSMGLFGFEMLI
jgi:hypothetical protein